MAIDLLLFNKSKTLIMQASPMRKISLLGLVLLAASAVTAAIMPKDKTDNKVDAYTLTASTGCSGQLTCSATVTPEAGAVVCDYTGDSTNNTTTGVAVATSWTTGHDHHTEPGGAGSTAEGENTSASPC